MVFKCKIDSVTRARVYYLCKIQGFPIRKVARMCHISRGSVWRIKKEGLRENKEYMEHGRKGRPPKLSARDGRQLVRAIKRLRGREGNFSCQRIMQEARISPQDVSVRTVTRFLNSQGFYYLQARKKGVLKADDMKKRLMFARKIKKKTMELTSGLKESLSILIVCRMPITEIHWTMLWLIRDEFGENGPKDIPLVAWRKGKKKAQVDDM